jgi:hypothetical protein
MRKIKKSNSEEDSLGEMSICDSPMLRGNKADSAFNSIPFSKNRDNGVKGELEILKATAHQLEMEIQKEEKYASHNSSEIKKLLDEYMMANLPDKLFEDDPFSDRTP